MVNTATNRFHLDLSRVKIVPNSFGHDHIFKKLLESASYDLIFFLSDGSVPTSLAKRNILHFQVPFSHVSMHPWKAMRYQQIVVNSEFTKNNLDTDIKIPITVIYPPVDIEGFRSGKKSKTILSVGRFSSLYGAKKQDILIHSFKEMYKKKICPGWRLVLAGGCLASDSAYLKELQDMAKGYPIEFQINCSYDVLRGLYEESQMYWHAAGYGETKPEHMEHFGITTVEAMAAGCIPIVYKGGGQTEIVQHGKNGYLWTEEKELMEITLRVLKDKKGLKDIQEEAKRSASSFSKDIFDQHIDALLI